MRSRVRSGGARPRRLRAPVWAVLVLGALLVAATAAQAFAFSSYGCCCAHAMYAMDGAGSRPCAPSQPCVAPVPKPSCCAAAPPVPSSAPRAPAPTSVALALSSGALPAAPGLPQAAARLADRRARADLARSVVLRL